MKRIPVSPRVAMLRCPAASGAEEIIRKTVEAIGLASGLAALRDARSIVVKPNIGIDRIRLTAGRQTELTEPAVVEGVLRAIRSVTDAPVLVGDAPTDDSAPGLYERLGYFEMAARFRDVRIVDFGQPPFVEVAVPGQPLQFSRYLLNEELAAAGAVISVAKMKAHVSLGCTLSIKNLFGLTPWRIYGQPRTYLHDRLIRLPRVQVDLAMLFRPALCVVDGIMTANHGEWHGTPVETGVILAGENCVAVDSVGMQVMGFNPLGDYPDHPHWYRRNTILLAHQAGVGTADPEEIEVVGMEPGEAARSFEVKPYGEGAGHRREELAAGVRSVEAYQQQRDGLVQRFNGRYLSFRDGELLWDAPDMAAVQALEKERCDGWREHPHFTIRAMPAAEEWENLAVYASGG